MYHWHSNEEPKTLYVEMSDSHGQMTVAQADEHIAEKMRQFPGSEWAKDFSPFMQETDNWDMEHPAELSEGNCWVVCTKWPETDARSKRFLPGL